MEQGIGLPLYFHPVVSSFFLLLSFFFPRLISAVGDWMSAQSRTGGVLGDVPSAAVRGRNSKCITSFCKGALYKHQKCIANALQWRRFLLEIGGRSAGN